jgi:hypothetical protein
MFPATKIGEEPNSGYCRCKQQKTRSRTSGLSQIFADGGYLSGSIESAIRRVINLRMKSSGTFWRIPKAERILVLRSSILSGRWDHDRERVKRGMQTSRKLAMPPIRESTLAKMDARLAPMETQ